MLSENIADYVIPIGEKFRDRYLRYIDLVELDSYLAWIESLGDPSPALLDVKTKITEYLSDPVVSERLDALLESQENED